MGKYTSNSVTSQDIERYIPLVHKIVNQLNFPASISVERDDLVSIGMYGLWDAYRRFDPRKQRSFESYASFRIRGAIIDEVRKMGLVPRKRAAMVKKLLLKQEELRQSLLRAPTDEELKEALEWDAIELTKTYAALNLMSVFSLESLLYDEEDSEGKQDYTLLLASSEENALTKLEREAQYATLHRVMKLLNPREQQLLQLHYVEGLNFQEISEVFEVSPSRVSQIYRQALSSLRVYMKA